MVSRIASHTPRALMQSSFPCSHSSDVCTRSQGRAPVGRRRGAGRASGACACLEYALIPLRNFCVNVQLFNHACAWQKQKLFGTASTYCRVKRGSAGDQ